MAFVTREQFLSANDLTIEVVHIPGLGELRIRTLTADDVDTLEQMNQESAGPDKKANLRGVRARLAMLSVVDENGKPLFTKADIDRIGAKSARTLNLIVNAVNKISGVTDQDAKEMAGNSVPGTGGDSPSA